MATLRQRGSEVARLLEHIQAEYESGVLGLSGFASGTATHEFITARMEQMGQLHHELELLVGEKEAITLFVQTVESSKE